MIVIHDIGGSMWFWWHIKEFVWIVLSLVGIALLLVWASRGED